MPGAGPILWQQMVREAESERCRKAPDQFAVRPVPRAYAEWYGISVRYYAAVDRLTEQDRRDMEMIKRFGWCWSQTAHPLTT